MMHVMSKALKRMRSLLTCSSLVWGGLVNRPSPQGGEHRFKGPVHVQTRDVIT
jgi:hypothetical protein